MRSAVLLALLALLASGCGSKSGIPARAADARASKPDDRPTPIPGGETFESPVYKMWAKFPAGTTVTRRTTTENEDSPLKTVTSIVYMLKEKTDDSVVVEFVATTTHPDGRVERNPPQENKTRRTFSLPPGIKRDTEKKNQESGEETFKVAGREFKTKWYKSKDFTEAGELVSQTWSSEDMPGGLVKSVSKVPAKRATITVEVTEVRIP